MSIPSYADSPVPVRDDLRVAHERAWQRLARPGTWWTGAERVAIAAEVRHALDCPLCQARQAALSPEHVSGEHATLGTLQAAALEATHRLTTAPGRLSRSWYEGLIARDLTDARYIELVGVVITVISIDAFCDGLGVTRPTLPAAQPGEPSQQRPAGARPGEAWVPMIPAGGAKGPEADLYGGGRPPGNVMRALSLVPEEVRGLKDLSAAMYLPADKLMDLRAGRTLDRMQIELLAGRVSALNECFY